MEIKIKIGVLELSLEEVYELQKALNSFLLPPPTKKLYISDDFSVYPPNIYPFINTNQEPK